MVKGRNEPCTIPYVAQVVAKVKGVSVEELCEAAWRNTIELFGMGEEVEQREA
jgi:TatD DNase family protein